MDKNVAAGIPLQKAKQLVFLVFVLLGFLGEYSVAKKMWDGHLKNSRIHQSQLSGTSADKAKRQLSQLVSDLLR
jgi:hypothetical protein